MKANKKKAKRYADSEKMQTVNEQIPHYSKPTKSSCYNV